MITVICGTNRPNSYSEKVALYYCKRLTDKKIVHQYFSLESMPQDLFINEMYEGNNNDAMKRIEQQYLTPADKFVFIFPEYNGSFPGVLKAFIDASDLAKCWHNKKACLIGVAAGRAGNLKGMDHFTSILNYIKINVLHMKIPISSVGNVVGNEGDILDVEIRTLIDEQINLFNAF
jgi:NAD(P)H-dependent FMN reductase